MAKQIQLRRGTTSQHSAFTGAAGEVTVDTDKKVVVVHDGSTAGGIPMAKDSTAVHTSGNETVAGVKTFSSSPIVPTATTGTQAVNKDYADAKVSKVTSTDNAVVRFDGTSGQVQNSSVIIDDSGNVGIGTSSPNTSIHLYKNSNNFRQITLENPFAGTIKGYISQWADGLNLSNNHYYTGSHAYSDNTKGSSEVIVNAGYIELRTSVANTVPTERMRIDSSGNVGIGVTPSAWNSNQKALQIGNSGAYIFGTVTANEIQIGTNAYMSSSSQFNYKNSSYASNYYQYNGSHAWQTAPSGTAGNPITWNTAMTLGSNGSLLVGTTTDNGVDKLQVNGSISATTAVVTTTNYINDANEIKNASGHYLGGMFACYAASNTPTTYGVIQQFPFSSSTDNVAQTFISVLDGRFWTRCKSGSWSAWVEK